MTLLLLALKAIEVKLYESLQRKNHQTQAPSSKQAGCIQEEIVMIGLGANGFGWQ